MKYFNLSCHLYLDARLYSEVPLYMDIKWCGWPGLKQKVSFYVCLHVGSFCDSWFPQRRIWSSDIVEGWCQRQRFKFQSLWVRTQKIVVILAQHMCVFKISRRWSSANEGIDCEKSSFNNVVMMFLCLATAVLLHPCCYQKEGVGTFLVCSCKSIGEELHTNTHASGSRRI